MATISTGTGLISGLDIKGLVGSLMAVQQQAVTRLQDREKQLQATQTGFTTLSANVLTLSVSAGQLAKTANFTSFKTTNSDPSQLTATASSSAIPGTYQFQTLRLAKAQQVLSKGFANADQQTIGAGKLVFAPGGRLDSSTALDGFNGGTGVRRGVIRVTDRSGASADIDLTAATTVTDVLDAINQADGISVSAVAQGDRIEIADASGAAAANLTVTDRNGGHAAQDLGINKSVAAATLTGNAVYQVTGAFTLAHLNDGNQPRFVDNLPDIRISLTDVPGTHLDVDLSGAATLNDVVNRINSHADNGGKVTAAISNGRLVLTDNTGGGGSGSLAVTDLNGATAARALGLDAAASGNTLTGNRLAAGINSVLLQNLRGGQGIGTPGAITLTDRTGTTATIDLSNATSLDEVLSAINAAQDGNGTRLKLTTALNAAGNGLQITDTSGATASNLVIADVGQSTLATQLGISVNAARNSVGSGSLNLRYANESTSLKGYAPGGGDVRRGSISITDSTGAQSFVVIPDVAKTVGDVLQRINAATGGRVMAQLNDTGDGFVLIDQAGGNGQLLVKDLDSSTAADLRIAGTGAAGLDGKSRIASREATVIDVTATDTLSTLSGKITAVKAGLTAAVVDDGSSFSPKRLVLTSKQTGAAGSFLFDDGGLGLGFELRSSAQNALLRVGADQSGGFLVSSSTNHFDAAEPGISVDVAAVGTAPARVDVTQDTGKISDQVSGFVRNYNDFIRKTAGLTKFESDTGNHGVLQGEGLVLRVSSALSDLASGSQFGPSGNTFRSLRDLGVNFNDDGTLRFDSGKLQSALARNPQAVADFFTTADTGFAAKLKATVESFTDPLTGKITAQTNGLQASVDTLEKRIATLSEVLAVRQQRLLNQFYNLETVLSRLNTQQTALGQLQNLSSTKTA